MPPLVVVMGVSGVGKSTIAEGLASALGLAHADGDDFHDADNIASMRAGTPLTDGDRLDWLDDIGAWLTQHDAAGGVVSCSALRRAYRDRLRAAAPRVVFVHLTAPHREVLERMQGREHFMPPSLLDSQEQILEPLDIDEKGWTIDASAPPAEIVRAMALEVSRS